MARGGTGLCRGSPGISLALHPHAFHPLQCFFKKAPGLGRQEEVTADFIKRTNGLELNELRGLLLRLLLQSGLRSSGFAVPRKGGFLGFLKIADFGPHLALISSKFLKRK